MHTLHKLKPKPICAMLWAFNYLFFLFPPLPAPNLPSLPSYLTPNAKDKTRKCKFAYNFVNFLV